MFSVERLENMSKETLIDTLICLQEDLDTANKVNLHRVFRIKNLRKERDELKGELESIKHSLSVAKDIHSKAIDKAIADVNYYTKSYDLAMERHGEADEFDMDWCMGYKAGLDKAFWIAEGCNLLDK